MMALQKSFLPVGLLAYLLCNSAVAAYLDFTDVITVEALSGGGSSYTGTIDGVAFTLSTSDGDIRFDKDKGYDGTLNTGCLSGPGPLECNKDGTGRRIGDGAGIDNDEITEGQTLNLIFHTDVYITSLDFLDLYVGSGTEQAIVSIDGAIFDPVIATETSRQGGYANLNLLSLGGPILGRHIALTATSGNDDFRDDSDNDYAFAGVEVSAVPIPAAAWLFGTALIGLVGFSKRRKAA